MGLRGGKSGYSWYATAPRGNALATGGSNLTNNVAMWWNFIHDNNGTFVPVNTRLGIGEQ